MTNIAIKTNFNINNLNWNLVDEIVKIWLYNSSENAIETAREKAPYLTWKLKQSIWRDPALISKWVKKVIIWPRKVSYAVVREFINRKNPDKKFYMKRTYEDIPNMIEKEFWKAVDIVFKKNNLI